MSAAPWEEELRDRATLERALSDAGLIAFGAELRTYYHDFTVEQFCSGWGGHARYMRHANPLERWEAFSRLVRVALADRFGSTITATYHIWIATGTKPSPH